MEHTPWAPLPLLGRTRCAHQAQTRPVAPTAPHQLHLDGYFWERVRPLCVHLLLVLVLRLHFSVVRKKDRRLRRRQLHPLCPVQPLDVLFQEQVGIHAQHIWICGVLARVRAQGRRGPPLAALLERARHRPVHRVQRPVHHRQHLCAPTLRVHQVLRRRHIGELERKRLLHSCTPAHAQGGANGHNLAPKRVLKRLEGEGRVLQGHAHHAVPRAHGLRLDGGQEWVRRVREPAGQGVEELLHQVRVVPGIWVRRVKDLVERVRVSGEQGVQQLGVLKRPAPLVQGRGPVPCHARPAELIGAVEPVREVVCAPTPALVALEHVGRIIGVLAAPPSLLEG